MEGHDKYMERCLELAGNGLGRVAPNPMVGCVIVNRGRIVGEGFHQIFGGPHAEVNAIDAVNDKAQLAESKLYVNLEPCSHFGKTPPCANLILHHEIPEIIIGTSDPNPRVGGNGIRRLEAAGRKVVTGVLENECRELNRRFFTFHEKRRPYIILKWAMTMDGFMDIERNGCNNATDHWITGEPMKMLVHKWRSEEQAIMAGTNTLLNDNPRLNVREWTGASPLRITIDKDLTLPAGLHFMDHQVPTLIFTARLKPAEENLEFRTIDFSRDIIPQILEDLYERQIQSLIVEGGRMLLESFIRQGIWDEARVLRGRKIFGKGLPAPILPVVPFSFEEAGNDQLMIYKNL